METYDVIVIGAGPGGYPAAIRAAQLGADVALVEQEAIGGTCLNWGCIPTKTLIASSSLYAHAQHADKYGLSIGQLAFDYPAMIRRKASVVAKLQGGIGQLLKAHGVTVFTGKASFVTRNRVAIANAQGETARIAAEKIIVATGSTGGVPGFLPASDRIVDSRAFLDRTELPKSMIVLGGGVIGCELACMAAQLGASVTVVELMEDILIMLDPDVRSEVRRYMERQLSIRVLTGKAIENVAASATGVKGQVAGETVEADLMLAAIGRKPYTEGLALENAGIKLNPKGYIPVDALGQTQAAGVFAIGDVNGGPQLAHVATAQGVVAAECAVGKAPRALARAVPSCIFTAPEVGAVGMTEMEAKAKNIDVKIGKFAFVGLGKAIASNETTGFVKWVVDAKSDQLLGAAAVGAHATDLISEALVAVQSEMTAHSVGFPIHAHPTLSEAWMEAAHAVHGVCIHAPPKRRKEK